MPTLWPEQGQQIALNLASLKCISLPLAKADISTQTCLFNHTILSDPMTMLVLRQTWFIYKMLLIIEIIGYQANQEQLWRLKSFEA